MKEKLARIFDRINELGLYGLVLFIPISKAGIEGFFTLAILCFYAKKALRPDFGFLQSRLNFFLLAFIVFSYLSLFNSGPYLKESFKNLFAKWSEYFLLFFMMEDAMSDPKRARRAVFVFLSVASLVCIDGLFQHVKGIDFLRERQLVEVSGGLYGLTASFQHYNDFGAYLVVAVSLVAALLMAGTRPRWLLYPLALALGWCLLLTFSRGAWLGFAASLLLMFCLSLKSKKVLPVVLVLVALIFLIPGIKERFAFTFGPSGDAGRFTLWKGAWQMIRQNPFLGKGPGTFMILFERYMPPFMFVQYAHNCYLQIWAETGIFSLLGFLLFAGTLVYNGIRSFRKNKSFILLGLVCGVFGFLVHSFFDTQLYSLQLSVLFWAAAGIIAGLSAAR